MVVPFSSDNTPIDLILTYKNNLLTRGDAQGTVPVIRFNAVNQTEFTLVIILGVIGVLEMCLILVDSEGGLFSAYQSDWIVVR